MILRRPTLADKETVLEMMAEFEQTQSAHDGGFWNANNFVYEEWLEENLQAEAGLIFLKTGFLLSSWLVLT